jgi:hypothetical protein
MLLLPNVTLCCIDFKNHIQALNAFEHSIREIKFGVHLFAGKTLNKYKIEQINTKEEYSRFIFKELVKYVETQFVLIIQWDGYIINPELWTNEFLNYDYIGAPWWHNKKNVGNGGFSLRSYKLLKCLQDESLKETHPEDDMICRDYRSKLEYRYGIKFAPEEVAKKFSFEPNPKYPKFKNDTFGFHGISELILNP